MDEDITAFDRRLSNLNTRLEPWYSDQYIPNLEEGASQLASHVGANPHAELIILLDELCAFYLQATSEQRDEVRRTVANYRVIQNNLYGYIYRSAKLLQETKDPHWLRMGLAAASIEDARLDFRDLLLALGELYIAACRAHIDPLPYFRAIGELSRNESHYGTGTTRGMLKNFHRYQYFVHDVAPRLHKEGLLPPWWKRL